MDRSERTRWSERFAISRQQLNKSFKAVLHVLEFDRWRRSFRKSIGENVYAWMSCAAILGWVLLRIPAKKEKVYLLPHGQRSHLREQKIKRRNPKAASEILSSAIELVFAVSLKVLERHLKSWIRSPIERNSASTEAVPSRPSDKAERETVTYPFGQSRQIGIDTRQAGKPKRAGVVGLFRKTVAEWMEDKCPQLGAALAYYTIQNANSYEVGLSPLWSVRRAFWEDRPAHEAALRANFIYRNNIRLYPAWQKWLRDHQPALLVMWGRYNPRSP